MKLIAVKKLEAGMVLAQDVFVAEESTQAFLRRGAVLTWKQIDALWRRGVTQVYIDAGDGLTASATGVPIKELARSTVKKPTPVLDEKLKEDAISSLENVFETVAESGGDLRAAAQVIQHLDSVVAHLVHSLQNEKTALVNIGDLKSYDDYTYHHSLSVALLSIGIGQYIGLKEDALNKLGLCAIMHDIGKTAVPVELIRKPARLTDDEFDVVKTHSLAGSAYLYESSVGDADMWAGVMFHHEKMDGTGYPNGLKGNDIPVWSRIISVADVYDALTSNRPYRQPMQPSEALEYIMGGSGSSFDYDIVSSFVQKVDLYPVGSFVELSDGRYAMVLDSENQQRPIVEILGSGDIVDLYRERHTYNVVVRRAVPDTELLALGGT